MNLTPDQERAVVTTGRDLVVLAGAGSGKTRVLVERIAHLVLDGPDPLPLSSVLAITFTEKAAREMKQRLAERFEKTGRLRARAEVESAYVSTIHGFCARLIRENAVEAGVDPDATILTDVQAKTLLRDVLGRVTSDLAARGGEAFEAVLRLGIPASGVVDSLLDLFEELRSAGVRPDRIEVAEPDPAQLRAALEEILAGLEPVGGLVDDLRPKSAAKAKTALLASAGVRDLLTSPPSFPEIRDALGRLFAALGLQVAKALKEIFRPIRDEKIPAARRLAAGILAAPSARALAALLTEVDEVYRQVKEDLGALDFSDLEMRARDLLQGSEDVRRTVRSRFKQVLVDEYQDVNPVQASILELVRDEGNHFAVGDRKQSIYGFRHAEPSLLSDRAEEAGPDGTVVLRENFRSSPGLVEFANHCFSRLFEGTALEVGATMEASADYAPAKEDEVEILFPDGNDAAEARTAEAVQIARRIREIVDGGKLRIRRAGPCFGEPVRFGDVAVLLRAFTDVKSYERAFEDADIPFYVVKGRGFYQAREVVDLIRLLSTVVNPRDEISLAAALRSPFGGITDDGLAALVAAARASGSGGRLSDLLERPDGVELAKEDSRSWSRFARLHERLRRLAARFTLRDVVETALAESGYETAVRLMPGGRRRAANLGKILTLADSFEGLFDLPAFLGAIEDFRVREVKETEAPTGGEQEDVVRLLTIHAAKGLEFPVVVLPDLSRRPVMQMPPLLLENGRIGARIASEVGEDPEETEEYAAAKAARTAREEEERLRLLYVAVTRAEEKLVLSARAGGAGRARGSFFEALSRVLAFEDGCAPYGKEDRRVRVVRPEESPSSVRRVSLAWSNLDHLSVPGVLPPPPEGAREQARRLLALADRDSPPAGATAYENTISELLTFATCPACCHARYQLGLGEVFEAADEEEPDEPAGADELPPTERGTLVHEVLRLWNPAGNEALPAFVTRRLPDRPSLARDVVAMVRAFYDCEEGAEVLAAPAAKVRREVPFLVRLKHPEEPKGLLLRGQIDLLYPGPERELRIVDYKTGRPGSGAYEVQLAAYARALEELSGRGVSAALAYLGVDGSATVEEVNLTPELRERTETAARQFASWLAAGAPPFAEHSPNCRAGGMQPPSNSAVTS